MVAGHPLFYKSFTEGYNAAAWHVFFTPDFHYTPVLKLFTGFEMAALTV